jgi:hypothetical protein
LLLPNLHNLLAGLYTLHEPRPRSAEGFQQMLLAAVTDSDPNKTRRSGGSENEMQKILVFADENVALRLRMPEYLSVGSLREADIYYMLRLATPRFDEAGQRRGS